MPLNLQVVEDALGGLPAFIDSGYHQVGAAHHVATGENLGIACLKGQFCTFRGNHAAGCIDCYVVLLEPRRRARAKAKGDYDDIGRQDFLGTGNDLRTPPALLVGFAQLGRD